MQVKAGKHENRVGEIFEDDVASWACYTIEGWDGTKHSGVRASEVIIIDRVEMVKIQIEKDRRPTVRSTIYVHEGPLQYRCGEVTEDDHKSKRPFRIKNWDGKVIDTTTSWDPTWIQTLASRPDTSEEIDEEMALAYDPMTGITLGDAQALPPPSKQSMSGLQDKIEARHTRNIKRNKMAHMQVKMAGRPTIGHCVRVKGGDNFVQYTGQIDKDDMLNIHCYEIRNWGTCPTPAPAPAPAPAHLLLLSFPVRCHPVEARFVMRARM